MEGSEEGTVWDGGGHRYSLEKVVGNGAFGIVWRARSEDGETVAIKKVLLDRRYHNRELQMMKVMDHENVVRLRHYFEKGGRKKDETYLHLVMDFLPETIRSVALQHHKRRKRFAVDHVKAYLWQTFRALEYIHARRICHRDIKPDNLLCDPATLKCRLCDFGCSKVLVKGQPNVSYICSRYYRAPELMFGATEYSVNVDIWSVGTILMELLLGHLPFQGQDSTQQHLVEIMKLLGTPSDRDLQAMRATCCADDLPKLKAFPWERLFPQSTPPEAIDLAQRLLRYDPDQRLTAPQALAHPFFDGAQQMIDGDVGGGSPVTRGSSRDSAALRGGPAAASEWEKQLQKYFDTMAESAALGKLEQRVLAAVDKLSADAAGGAELSQQLAGFVRQEVAGSLKQRDDTARGIQKRLVAEAQQLNIAAPLAFPGGSGAGGGGAGSSSSGGGGGDAAERERLERELATMQREAQQTAQRFEVERAELVAQLEAARQAVTEAEGAPPAYGGALPGAHGPGREVGVQTEEEVRMPSAGNAGHGRRAAAPSRQGTAAFGAEHMAVASPLHTRGGDGGGGSGHNLAMLHTDNLGQVTPLSSFSPGGAQDGGAPQGRPSCVGSSPLANGAPRVSSAGRGRRATRLSEGYSAEDIGQVPEGAEG